MYTAAPVAPAVGGGAAATGGGAATGAGAAGEGSPCAGASARGAGAEGALAGTTTGMCGAPEAPRRGRPGGGGPPSGGCRGVDGDGSCSTFARAGSQPRDQRRERELVADRPQPRDHAEARAGGHQPPTEGLPLVHVAQVDLDRR